MANVRITNYSNTLGPYLFNLEPGATKKKTILKIVAFYILIEYRFYSVFSLLIFFIKKIDQKTEFGLPKYVWEVEIILT